MHKPDKIESRNDRALKVAIAMLSSGQENIHKKIAESALGDFTCIAVQGLVHEVFETAKKTLELEFKNNCKP